MGFSEHVEPNLGGQRGKTSVWLQFVHRPGMKAVGLLLVLALTTCGSRIHQPTRAGRVGAVERPDVCVYMREHAKQASIAAVERRLRGLRSVEAFAYISSSDGYDEVQRDGRYPASEKAAINRRCGSADVSPVRELRIFCAATSSSGCPRQSIGSPRTMASVQGRPHVDDGPRTVVPAPDAAPKRRQCRVAARSRVTISGTSRR